MDKEINSYKTIGEVVKILGLKSKKGLGNPSHIIRYWEKEFKQIKPKKLTGNRRYYDNKNIELLKKIHFLLKDQGMTINGVRKILNNNEPLIKLSIEDKITILFLFFVAQTDTRHLLVLITSFVLIKVLFFKILTKSLLS
jgi:DNA-binding transcriptional MerR regulator